jgi:drug/metabolite transporter (DMT)-like permease
LSTPGREPGAGAEAEGPPPSPALPRVSRRIDLPAVLAATLTIACWASNFPALRFAVREIEPAHIALLRFLVASLLLGGYALVARMPMPALRDVAAFLFFGFTGLAVSTVVLSMGMESVSAGAGSFLVGTIPVFSALWARFFLAERLGSLGWLGIAVSFAGVGLIALGEGEGLRLNLGAGLVVLSAFCQSIFYVFQKPYHRRYSPMQITSYATWGATLWLLVFVTDLPEVLRSAPTPHVLAVVYLGVFPTAVAFAAWAYALSRAKAAKVTSAMYVMPALALGMAYLWLGEVPTLFSLAGGLLALVGVVLLNFWGR